MTVQRESMYLQCPEDSPIQLYHHHHHVCISSVSLSGFLTRRFLNNNRVNKPQKLFSSFFLSFLFFRQQQQNATKSKSWNKKMTSSTREKRCHKKTKQKSISSKWELQKDRREKMIFWGCPGRPDACQVIRVARHPPPRASNKTVPCQRTAKVPAIENLTVGLYNII